MSVTPNPISMTIESIPTHSTHTHTPQRDGGIPVMVAQVLLGLGGGGWGNVQPSCSSAASHIVTSHPSRGNLEPESVSLWTVQQPAEHILLCSGPVVQFTYLVPPGSLEPAFI